MKFLFWLNKVGHFQQDIANKVLHSLVSGDIEFEDLKTIGLIYPSLSLFILISL